MPIDVLHVSKFRPISKKDFYREENRKNLHGVPGVTVHVQLGEILKSWNCLRPGGWTGGAVPFPRKVAMGDGFSQISG